MSFYPDNPDRILEPLPSSYDEQLKRLDAMLSSEALGHSPPAGLVQRTFEASVVHLPGQRSLKISQPIRQRWPMLSRLSMAAAIMLAVLAGVVFLRSPGSSGLNGTMDHYAHNGVTVTPVSTHGSRPASLSVDQEWVLLDSVQLAHFAEMRHLSLAEVTDDLAMIVHELEM